MTSSPPIITVGIVTFHTPIEMLKATLESLRICTLPMEVVIVDNTLGTNYFSTLQTLEGVRCIKSPVNSGYGYGHNLACKSSSSAPYHLILNPDVVIQPGCLEALVAGMDKESNIGMNIPKIYFPNGELQPLNRRDPTVLDLCLRRFVPACLQSLPPIRRRMDYFIMMDHGYDVACDVPNASGCCMLIRRDIFDAIGGFDERFFMYFEDSDLTRRVRARARARYVPEAKIIHCWARGSHTNWRLTLVTLKSAWKYFQKWGWKWW